MERTLRKILAVSLAAAFLPYGAAFSADEEEWTCPVTKGAYVGQICDCLKARQPGGAGAKSITDYVCPEPIMGDADVAYRVILDLEFKKTDKEAEGKLKQMQAATGNDFVKMDTDITNWFDTTSADSEFHQKYSKTCADLSDPKSVLRQTVESMSGVTSDGSTSFFAGNQERCDSLTKTKLAGYKSAARLFAQQNVADSYKSDKKDFIDQLKDIYRNFLMKWMVYIGELSRIKSKWNEKTPTVNN